MLRPPTPKGTDLKMSFYDVSTLVEKMKPAGDEKGSVRFHFSETVVEPAHLAGLYHSSGEARVSSAVFKAGLLAMIAHIEREIELEEAK